MPTDRKPYDTDISDDEWAFVAPYLSLLTADAGQRRHDPREVLNALRWLIRSGSPWRLIPHDLPPWHAVYDQARRWPTADCFEAIVHDLRKILRLVQGRNAHPSAAIVDSRTVQSTPESGSRTGSDGYKRRKGSKVHMAVDTLGHLLALHVTPTYAQDRVLCGRMQELTGKSIKLVYADRGYTGEATHDEAAGHEIVPKWSSCPRRSGVSSSCPATGWSSVRSVGWPASAAWRGTTSG